MIYTLVGTNTHARDVALKARTSELTKQHKSLDIVRIDAADKGHEHIIDAISHVPMFEAHRLVIIRDFTSDKLLVMQLEKIALNIPETISVILIADKLDKRTEAYKLLRKLTKYSEFNSAEKDPVGWLIAEAKSQGGELDRQTAQRLLDTVGTDQTLLANELAKLIAYAPTITTQTIALLCEPLPQSSTFQLLDAAFAGNGAKAQALYDDQRRQRVEPLAILAMVAWQLHILALVQASNGAPPDTIAKQARISPFVVTKAARAVRGMSATRLRKLIQQTLDLDIRLKTQSIDADAAMRHYLMTLTQAS
ncbi:DNA polymerase III subunit delta [Candidatus Saccharibacteria bacterium]|nr:DNA polymerase III subunit delta [Candidatus Saccharibacteria bacterium]